MVTFTRDQSRMSLARPIDEPAAPGADRADGAFARGGVFLAAFTLALVSLHPFADLRQELPDEKVTGRDALDYFAFLGLAAVAFALSRRHAAPAFAALMRPALIALCGWVLATAMMSYDPSTSLKRAVLCLLVMTTAAAAPLLPRGRAELVKLIAVAALIPLALSYFGVVFLPHLAIHTAADAGEPELAGDWRGVFDHKNVACPVFGLIAFCGLYVAGEGRRRLGFGIAGASLLFVLFTDGKTSTALWLPALIVGIYAVRAAGTFTFSALAIGPALVMSALGFGAQMFPIFRKLDAWLPFDATFTGRADVWRFAATKLVERPIAGRGFDAFWDDPAVRDNTEQGWATTAAHAHNGYVDATLAMGLIGLALTLWAFVLQPLSDLATVRQRGEDRRLAILCAQIWLYGIWVSSLETFLFDRANPVWFLFLFAVFTLRYLATFRSAP